jgi:hypothetical protein
MNKKSYPYQILSLKDLQGEEWRDVPGFDAEYEVSNFGRIKSLRRWRNAGRNQGYYTKEIIRKPILRPSKNNSLNNNTYSIGITLKQDGSSVTTSTARYVYYTFVKPFDLADDKLLISYKDFNGLNLHYKNLILTTRREIMKRVHSANRIHISTKEKVNQLGLDGKRLATYNSLTEAAFMNGFSISGIRACALGKIFQHKGFKWQYVTRFSDIEPKQKKAVPIFNKYLWKKLRRPKTFHSNPIPTLNLSPDTLKGEKWKPIEDLDEAYWISNYGRVKTISRFKKGNLNVWTKAIMKRLIPDGKPHHPTSCLLVQLSRNGKKYQQSVGRLVYYYFVKPF